jgi:hypothetical protein
MAKGAREDKIKMPKLPRKIKKAAFSDRWNYGFTKRKFNKFKPIEGSIAYQICMWYCFKTLEDRGYKADELITKHRLFKIKG